MASAYVLLGHGAEHLTAPRHEVPPGSMLVVAEECGVAGALPLHVYEAFQSPELAPLFADPVTHKRALEVLLKRRLKIYRAGASYPHMTFTLVNSEEAGADENPNTVDVGPSGVWPVPSPPHSMTFRPDQSSYDRYTVPAARAGTTFRDSVFPFEDEERHALVGLSLRALNERPSLRTSAHAIMTARPGIYYHFLCRVLAGPNANLEEIMGEAFSENAERLFYSKRAPAVFNAPALVQNWLQERPPLVPTAEQAEALNRMNAIVRRVMTRRRASRSSSGRRHAEEVATWTAAHRRIAHGMGTEEQRLALAAAVPAPQLDKQESHTGATLLSVAARAGDAEVVRLLLSRGANPAIADWEKITPLHWGARAEDSAETVAALLGGGASADVHDVNRNTVLHGATAGAIPLLLEAGVPHSVQNVYGSTPLHMAAGDGDAAAVEALVVAGARVNARDRDDETPLMLAAAAGAHQVVKDLIAAGADVRIRSNNRKTALVYAMESADDDTALAILQAGAAVTHWDRLREMAVDKEMPKVIKFIDER